MRKLQTSDLFDGIRLIKKINLKEELKEIALNSNQENDLYSLGFDTLFTVIEKCCEKKVEKELYEFLAKPFEMTAKEIETMDPFDLFNGILEIASIEKWKVFLKQAIR